MWNRKRYTAQEARKAADKVTEKEINDEVRSLLKHVKKYSKRGLYRISTRQLSEEAEKALDRLGYSVTRDFVNAFENKIILIRWEY